MYNILKYILILALFIPQISKGQTYILPNEKLIYSFETTNHKVMFLCQDKSNKYMIYRFGTKGKIEFEFPEQKDNSSWGKFLFSSWLRGGGVKNEGIDLNFVSFVNNRMKYIIYNTYYAVGNRYNTGIRVINLISKKEIDIKGNMKTRKGTLTDLRDNKLIGQDDELYD